MKSLLLLLASLPAFAGAEVHYTLAPEPVNRSVRVTITPSAAADRISFRMPAWVPGFYVLLPHYKKVSDARATDAKGKPLKVLPQTNPHTWVVENPGRSKVTFSYRVLGDDPGLGFFGVNVRPSTTFVSGPAAFMYVEGRKEEPTTLKIINPEGWDIGTSMSQGPDGLFRARDYDELADHPIDLGKFTKRQFTFEGVVYEADFVTLDQPYSPALADAAMARFRQLIVPAIRMFGGVPFKKYVFHIHLAVGSFTGGLEHQASVTIALGPQAPMDRFDDLFTHEFFHVWNVKHIRPKVLGPFDYTQEVRTDKLWFSEGVTDYYAKLHAYQSGLRGAMDYLFPALQGEVRALQGGTTRLEKTAADASRGAWEGGSQGTGDLSYYNKGQLIGWILDAAIRSGTKGQKSLDDVFRFMFARYRLPDKPGFEEDGILRAVNAVSGLDLTALYNKMVYSTDELPYEVLEGIGIRVVLPGQEYPTLGFTTDGSGNVTEVSDPLSQQGLLPGDRIITLAGRPFSVLPHGLTPGGYVMNVRRGGEAMRLELRPVAEVADNYLVMPNYFANDEQFALLQGWLKRPGGIK